MIKAQWASARDREEIIDFIDFVFSKSKRPHDFETMLPRLYAPSANASEHHYILREEGRIIAAVLALPIRLNVRGETLTALGVGSVSVHPRARGRGYMHLLMQAVDDRAKAMQADFAFLGGQRQRYGYYGYRYDGRRLEALITPDNVRHAFPRTDALPLVLRAMSSEDLSAAHALHSAQSVRCERRLQDFDAIIRSWDSTPFVLEQDGVFAGYGTHNIFGGACHIGELLLKDEALLPSAIRLLSASHGPLAMTCAPWETQRTRLLTDAAQRANVTFAHCIKHYRKEHTLSVCGGLGADNPYLASFGATLPLSIPSPDCV